MQLVAFRHHKITMELVVRSNATGLGLDNLAGQIT